MKKLFAMILILALLLPGAAVTSETSKLEGGGWDTPEQAVLAYLDAMNRADVGGMLSTFAMESFAAHVDTRLFVERIKGMDPTMLYGVPVTGNYSRSLMIAARYGMLAKSLVQQYAEYCAKFSQSRTGSYIQATPEDMQAFEDAFAASCMHGLAGHVEFVEWINPAQLTQGKITLPNNGRNGAAVIAYYGADDIAELAAHIRVNGLDGLQVMQCVKYGDRWFNGAYGGQIANIMGVSVLLQPLTLPDDMEQAQQFWDGVLAEDCAEACAQWDALRLSGLAGTRWLLKQVSVPGVAVAQDKNSAESAEGLSVFAELRFYSFGGALINVYGSAALQEQLSMIWGNACICMSWRETDGKLEIEQIRGMNKSHIVLDLALDGVTLNPATNLLFGADTVTFQLSSGVAVTFEKR